MPTASLVFLTLILVILAIDKIFMPKKAKKAWQMMAFTYSVGIIFTIFPEILSSFAKIIGVGRGVDVVLYVISFLLVREIFLSRARQSTAERQLTILARNIAISNAETITKPEKADG